jgi:uncharacterized cupredoxin-like copper-binding protein
VRVIRTIAVLLGIASLSLAVASCGDDNDTEGPADRGEVISAELGESGPKFFVRPEKNTADSGTVTFAVTNMGKLYHEFIVYSNADGIDPGDLPVNEEGEADLVEENIVGEAPYATPPIVPPDKEPGDADHRIRAEGWGAELTVDLEAGKYILLCNLAGHYSAGQYAAFTAQ